MVKVILGLVIGMLITSCIWVVIILDLDNGNKQCMTQEVYLLDPTTNRTSPFIIMGEVVICGSNWEISNIMGPYAENFYGRINLRKWNSDEFQREE